MAKKIQYAINDTEIFRLTGCLSRCDKYHYTAQPRSDMKIYRTLTKPSAGIKFIFSNGKNEAKEQVESNHDCLWNLLPQYIMTTIIWCVGVLSKTSNFFSTGSMTLMPSLLTSVATSVCFLAKVCSGLIRSWVNGWQTSSVEKSLWLNSRVLQPCGNLVNNLMQICFILNVRKVITFAGNDCLSVST